MCCLNRALLNSIHSVCEFVWVSFRARANSTCNFFSRSGFDSLDEVMKFLILFQTKQRRFAGCSSKYFSLHFVPVPVPNGTFHLKFILKYLRKIQFNGTRMNV